MIQDNGEIYIFGKDSKGKFNELKDLFGYCSQNDSSFNLMTVYENLKFFARIKGIKENLIEQEVQLVMKEMCLDSFKNKLAGRLSRIIRRKLSVAIAMIGNPQILLLDEPSTGMDLFERRSMWRTMNTISGIGKSSLIITTNSIDEAEILSRRMGIMANGEFVCLGTTNQIKEKYCCEYEIDIRVKL